MDYSLKAFNINQVNQAHLPFLNLTLLLLLAIQCMNETHFCNQLEYLLTSKHPILLPSPSAKERGLAVGRWAVQNEFYCLQYSIIDMAELETSKHSLNNSTSKQKFSFPKTDRFRNNGKMLCDSFYDIPDTRNSRATSFGYGNKTMGLRNERYIPPVGSYELGTQFKKDEHKGFTFGSGRDEMQLSGPLQDSKIHKFIPGPGNYDSNKSMLDHRAVSLKPRLPDTSQKHLLKNPGPGAYQFEEIGTNMYYATSKYRNYTNHKISPGSRLAEIERRSTIEVGPASYSTQVEDLNTKGRYNLSNHENSKTRLFDKAPRQELVFKHMIHTPAPGQYATFSSFG